MNLPELIIKLPDWVDDFISEAGSRYPDIEARMQLAIKLSRLNIEQQTGGPFAAVIFDENGNLIAPGVNMVMNANCSILHAEIVAIALAQKLLNRFDLSDGGRFRFDLVSTTEPCAMCFGAVPWSGVGRLICAARDEDARKIGFDEGAKPADWISELQKRGITVMRDVLRAEAVKVLEKYQSSGGPIYNPSFNKQLD
jgi:tRNA(Arg) A34 adenosine deaminase TadA